MNKEQAIDLLSVARDNVRLVQSSGLVAQHSPRLSSELLKAKRVIEATATFLVDLP